MSPRPVAREPGWACADGGALRDRCRAGTAGNGASRRTAWRLVLLMLASALTLSCSLDYGETDLATEISEDTPDTILYNVTHTIVRDGRPRFIVEAERAETYSGRKRQYLSQVQFSELAEDGSIVTDGTARFAEYQVDTEDVELSGELRFFSAEEDAWLTAEYLYWDSEDRLLSSRNEEPVSVARGDGTLVRGRGFVAEMGRSIIRFDAGVSGTLIEDESPE